MTTRCESCSMTIESGPYCEHCAEGDVLRDFDEIATRFDQWTARRNPDEDPDTIRAKTLAFMATMPAWKDHPCVRGA